MGNTFRETMWFKLGEQDSQEMPVEGDGAVADETESVAPAARLPIEDRYRGEVSPNDTATFGLHTGMTDRLKALKTVSLADDDVPMASLVREMKSMKRTVLIGAGAAVLCTVFALYLM